MPTRRIQVHSGRGRDPGAGLGWAFTSEVATGFGAVLSIREPRHQRRSGGAGPCSIARCSYARLLFRRMARPLKAMPSEATSIVRTRHRSPAPIAELGDEDSAWGIMGNSRPCRARAAGPLRRLVHPKQNRSGISANPARREEYRRSMGQQTTAILGISAFYHDSAAALVVDGRVVAAAQEERFTRIKHDPAFPGRAV